MTNNEEFRTDSIVEKESYYAAMNKNNDSSLQGPEKYSFQIAKTECKNKFSIFGVHSVAWSFDGHFFSSYDKEKPYTLWIWSSITFNSLRDPGIPF